MIVFYNNHFTIHNGNNLLGTVYGRSPKLNRRKGRKNIEIYFETDDIEAAYRTVRDNGIKIIHGIEKQAWGQKVFRFYDPDRHILEIGEVMHQEYLKEQK